MSRQQRKSELRQWADALAFTAVALALPAWFTGLGPGRHWGTYGLYAWIAYWVVLAAAWLGTARLRARRARQARRGYQRKFRPSGSARPGGQG